MDEISKAEIMKQIHGKGDGTVEMSWQLALYIGKCLNELAEIKESQEPVKPIRAEGLDVCGFCKRPVYRSLCERFCPGCGKRVLWDE